MMDVPWLKRILGVTLFVGGTIAYVTTEPVLTNSLMGEWLSPSTVIALGGFIYSLGINGQRLKDMERRMQRFEQKLDELLER